MSIFFAKIEIFICHSEHDSEFPLFIVAYLRHAQSETPKQPNQKQQFLDALPLEFSRQDYLKTAQSLNIADKTAEKHIAKFVQNGLINHFAHDKYPK